MGAERKWHTRVSASIDKITSRSVVLTNGVELEADLVVCATGFGNMVEWVGQLVSEETAERVGPVWGYGSNTVADPGPWEGEQRNIWKPTRQKGLWFTGERTHAH